MSVSPPLLIIFALFLLTAAGTAALAQSQTYTCEGMLIEPAAVAQSPKTISLTLGSTPKDISIDSTDEEAFEGDESLKLDADAEKAPNEAAVATQAIATVPNTDEGTQYFLSVQAMSKDLSREVPVEVRVLYPDNSSDFYVAGPAGLTTGIPKDTEGKWVELTALVVARKPIEQIDVYAFDSGVEKLTGSAWVDDIHLRQVEPGSKG